MNLRMCLNWKVIGGLAAVGVGIWVLAPGAIAAALPLLLLAACPLSMAIMAFGMKGMRGKGVNDQSGSGAADEYTCPMHPGVKSATPGRCPTCGMALVPVPAVAREPASPADQPGGVERPREPQLADVEGELATLQAQQAALAQQIALLEATRPPITAGH